MFVGDAWKKNNAFPVNRHAFCELSFFEIQRRWLEKKTNNWKMMEQVFRYLPP